MLNGRSLKELCAVAALLGSMTLAGGAARVPQTANPPATDPARAKRLEWFREAKYGLFIHWGLYAIPAGEWKGKRSLGLGEWIMNRSQIPVKEYEQLAAQFNPVKFDPDAWVQLAQDAGMKYIVITSKHHDGFAMFKSKVSRYNVVDATPFKRDVLKAAGRRVREAGHAARASTTRSRRTGTSRTAPATPGTSVPTRGRTARSSRTTTSTCAARRSRRSRSCSPDYGPVALIWFDTPRMMTPERGKRFADIVRSLQPTTLIDGRLGTEGDYRSTGDNVIPLRSLDRSVGDARDDQRHLGLPQPTTRTGSRPARSPSSSSTSSARAATTC